MAKSAKSGLTPSAAAREEFVRVWQDPNTQSVQEVARKLGIKPTSASAKAARLRKAGVPLRRFPAGRGGGPRVDWSRLAQIAAEARQTGKNKTDEANDEF